MSVRIIQESTFAKQCRDMFEMSLSKSIFKKTFTFDPQIMCITFVPSFREKSENNLHLHTTCQSGLWLQEYLNRNHFAKQAKVMLEIFLLKSLAWICCASIVYCNTFACLLQSEVQSHATVEKFLPNRMKLRLHVVRMRQYVGYNNVRADLFDSGAFCTEPEVWRTCAWYRLLCKVLWRHYTLAVLLSIPSWSKTF